MPAWIRPEYQQDGGCQVSQGPLEATGAQLRAPSVIHKIKFSFHRYHITCILLNIIVFLNIEQTEYIKNYVKLHMHSHF